MVSLPKRRGREVNASKARADGFYLKGKSKFKIVKGSKLPSVYDSIHYYGEDGVSREIPRGGAEAFANNIANEQAAEDTDETPETPKKGRTTKKATE